MTFIEAKEPPLHVDSMHCTILFESVGGGLDAIVTHAN